MDFEKAYDRIDWGFLGEVLKKKGFGSRWRRWIAGCLNSVNFSVMINSRPNGKIKAARGLRQGDPLSPFYLCLMRGCIEFIMKRASEKEVCREMRVGRENIEISHLQFVNVTILFSNGSEVDVGYIMEIVQMFCKVSGLKINPNKSQMLGSNIDDMQVDRVANQWRCERGLWPIT